MADHIVLREKDCSHRLYDKRGRPLARMNRFLEAVEVRGLSRQTVRAYGYDLLYLAQWLQISKKSWRRFSQRDLLAYIAFQRERRAKPKSINRRLSTCESYYKFCFGEGPRESTGVNRTAPFYKGRGRSRHLGLFHLSRPRQVKIRVKEPRPLVEILTSKEVREFLSGVKRYRDLGIVYLMLLCGLRFSEVLWLKISSVSFFEGTIRVFGKGSKERILPLPQELEKILRKYLALERPSGRENEPFFVVLQGSRHGEPMTVAGLRSLFRYRRKKTGINKANPHRFRHTFGSRMAAERVSLPVLQRLMGHADLATTLHYIHLSTTDLAAEFHRAMTEIQGDYEIQKTDTRTI